MGIILRTRPYGENHRTVVVLTERRGAVRAIAYGAQKTQNPLHAIVQALVRGLFLLRRNDGAPGTILQGVAVDMYDGLRSDLRKAAYAQAVLELALVACRDDAGQGDGLLYQATQAALEQLKRDSPGRLVMAGMGIAVAAELGIALECGQCAECGARLLRPGRWYSMSAGGLLCERCADTSRPTALLHMDRDAAALLASLCEKRELPPSGGEEQSPHQVLQVVLAHLEEFGGVVVKSLRVLGAME